MELEIVIFCRYCQSVLYQPAANDGDTGVKKRPIPTILMTHLVQFINIFMPPSVKDEWNDGVIISSPAQDQGPLGVPSFSVGIAAAIHQPLVAGLRRYPQLTKRYPQFYYPYTTDNIHYRLPLTIPGALPAVPIADTTSGTYHKLKIPLTATGIDKQLYRFILIAVPVSLSLRCLQYRTVWVVAFHAHIERIVRIEGA